MAICLSPVDPASRAGLTTTGSLDALAASAKVSKRVCSRSVKPFGGSALGGVEQRDVGPRDVDRLEALAVTQGDTRTAFVYIDGDTSTSRELEDWAAERGYEATFSLDPAWDAVRAYR
jgi:hypothetical protein